MQLNQISMNLEKQHTQKESEIKQLWIKLHCGAAITFILSKPP